MQENNFYNMIQEEVRKIIGDEGNVQIKEIRKNNGVVYTGLIVQKTTCNIAPTIYLNEFYERYRKGESLEKVIEEIRGVYEKGEIKATIDMNFFLEFEKVKDRIAFRLINAEKNKELLDGIPHVLYLDLAICFYYAFYHEEIGEGMILIHNSHLKMWGTNHEELMKLALKNTKRLFPPTFITMSSVLGEMGIVEAQIPSLYVLTNQQKTQGSVAILYQELLEEVANELGGSFYILPSSVHEVIVLRGQGGEDAATFHEMITEANATQVLEEEILSDYPYFYDTNLKKVILLKEV